VFDMSDVIRRHQLRRIILRTMALFAIAGMVVIAAVRYITARSEARDAGRRIRPAENQSLHGCRAYIAGMATAIIYAPFWQSSSGQ
jgi:hypothetical protein